MLQVKNRSNSENSSSNKVRKGKKIKKWFRIDATTGHTNWPVLLKIVGENMREQLNEESFQGFIKQVLEQNKDAFAIDNDNPWVK